MCKFVNVPIVLFEDVFEPRRHEEHKGTQKKYKEIHVYPYPRTPFLNFYF